ncbi:MAG: bifunctional phosphoribosylaminoimidazolecarboxamide formyltransferase/IMP cyclohydrolase [Candidatus Eremiobacteraeota bacterium]|nr:bifunctional phosphoribosylaminoimidazolecarboxamide formyltransferase/IMP cyclohydrolase [Candidatus Eremiobacteraeota bacterium]
MLSAVPEAALLSLTDKRGLIELASALRERGLPIFATSGTADGLRSAGIDSRLVEDITGFAQLGGGRVKTLHPLVFAGILARSAADLDELASHAAPAFSVVAVNLYPFERTASQCGSQSDVLDDIDIGGVALLRAAAKNFHRVSVLSDPSQYAPFLDALSKAGPSLADRRALAVAAYRRCERYDGAIARWFERSAEGMPAAVGLPACELPDSLPIDLTVRLRPRYGENPWAKAAFYSGVGDWELPVQLAGKALSYNNLLDVDACLRLLAPAADPAGFPSSAAPKKRTVAAIVKHTVPCGVAAADSAAQALHKALGADPMSAFGGIVACDERLDEIAAQVLKPCFLEVIAAPGYTEAALHVLRSKKHLRVLRYARSLPERLQAGAKVRSALGGVLIEVPDAQAQDDRWEVVSQRQPLREQWRDLLFAFAAVRQVKSNAAVVVRDQVTLGMCGGQTNRVSAVALACARAADAARGAVLATDGFFPFADGVQAAAQAGIAAIVAPYGSIRDREIVAAAHAADVCLVFAQRRYFLH